MSNASMKAGETKETKTKKAVSDPVNIDCLDVNLPSATNAGECSVLVQIEPQHATHLDLEGATGAIGRFEAGPEGVTLDLKGYQYHGVIHPGPTAMVLVMGKGGQLKVDGISDEFVTLSQTQDIMAKLDAVVDGDLDQGYQIMDDDVNGKYLPTESIDSTTNPGKQKKRQKATTKRLTSKKKKVETKAT